LKNKLYDYCHNFVFVTQIKNIQNLFRWYRKLAEDEKPCCTRRFKRDDRENFGGDLNGLFVVINVQMQDPFTNRLRRETGNGLRRYA